MIGIIVAASVIAAFFVIMAATVPLYKRDVVIVVRDNSIQANSTDNKALSFRTICDYDDGYIKKIDIIRGSSRIAYRDVDIYMTKNSE